MSISFVTPLGGLVVLVGLVPLVVLVVSRRRLGALCGELGIKPPGSRSAVPTALAIAAVAGLLALAAAGPVAARKTTHSGRADTEVFFVFDVSRSMGARLGDGPTRLDRARTDAKALRAALDDLPVGIASLTDRLLPHLFPSMSVNAFNATVAESLAVDRPTMSFDFGNTLGTKLGTLANIVGGRYFRGSSTHRIAVVFTDGETRPDELSTLSARFEDGNVHALFFRYWSRRNRGTTRQVTSSPPTTRIRPAPRRSVSSREPSRPRSSTRRRRATRRHASGRSSAAAPRPSTVASSTRFS